MGTLAITREVSRAIARCELTHVERVEIDVDVARSQHGEYVELLRNLGCEVIELPEQAALPDSVFVEDTALVYDEVAVLTRPGAESRRPEVESVGAALADLRPIVRIEAPATIDGGDVMRLGKDVFVGLSSRSTASGVEALEAALRPHGYRVHGVPMRDCLHLKTAVCALDDETFLWNPAWVDRSKIESLAGRSYAAIEVDPDEPFAANAFPVNETIVHAASHERTRAHIESRGFRVATVPADELAKAEGGVTCCSLILAT